VRGNAGAVNLGGADALIFIVFALKSFILDQGRGVICTNKFIQDEVQSVREYGDESL